MHFFRFPYKALYIIAQKRQESGFRLKNYHGNIFNITGKGDAGSVKYSAPEYNKKTGKYEMIEQDYAIYSSNDAAAAAYIKLIKELPRYKDTWNALTDNKAGVKDFAIAIKKGGYASDPNYATELEKDFNSVKNDYQKIITSKINENNRKIDSNNKYIISLDAKQDGILKAKNENVMLNTINEKLNADLNELSELK